MTDTIGYWDSNSAQAWHSDHVPSEYPDGSPAGMDDLTPIERIVLPDVLVLTPDPEDYTDKPFFACAACGERL